MIIKNIPGEVLHLKNSSIKCFRNIFQNPEMNLLLLLLLENNSSSSALKRPSELDRAYKNKKDLA
jgi:hypothetical protein